MPLGAFSEQEAGNMKRGEERQSSTAKNCSNPAQFGISHGTFVLLKNPFINI